MAQFWPYFFVFGLSALKVVPGALLATVQYKFGFFASVFTVALGGWLGTAFFLYFGQTVRGWFAQWRRRRRLKAGKPVKDPGPNTNPKGAARKIWDRYGIWGVALLTPPFLSPPGGAAVAVAFGAHRGRFLWIVLVSMLAWATLFALMGEGLGNLLAEWGLYDPEPSSVEQVIRKAAPSR